MLDKLTQKFNACTAQHSTAQHSTAQHSTAQHSTAQHSTAQHSTAQHSTAQHSTAAKKLSLAALISLPLFSFAVPAHAVDGCKALLCFAGGMHVTECQSTIKEVIRDMGRGKPFPTCEGAEDVGIIARRKSFEQTSYTSGSQVSTCPDGTRAHFIHGNNDQGWHSTCKYIDISIPADIAADGEHEQQRHYY